MPASGYGQRGYTGRISCSPGGAGAHPPASHGAQLRYDEPRVPCLDLHDGSPTTLLGRRRRRRPRLPREAPGGSFQFNSIQFNHSIE